MLVLFTRLLGNAKLSLIPQWVWEGGGVGATTKDSIYLGHVLGFLDGIGTGMTCESGGA